MEGKVHPPGISPFETDDPSLLCSVAAVDAPPNPQSSCTRRRRRRVIIDLPFTPSSPPVPTLIDSGAEVSIIDPDTVANLGLSSSIDTSNRILIVPYDHSKAALSKGAINLPLTLPGGDPVSVSFHISKIPSPARFRAIVSFADLWGSGLLLHPAGHLVPTRHLAAVEAGRVYGFNVLRPCSHLVKP